MLAEVAPIRPTLNCEPPVTPTPHHTASGSTPLRVGVVGLGAGSVHARAYAALPTADLVALSGKETERLAALGSELSVPRLVTTWEELVEMDDLDAISVATPNALHHPITMAALAAGKHVFCEKPLALNADQAREMVDAARAHDRVLEVSFNHRRRADVQWARAYIETEGIGELYHARASWKRRAGIPGLGSWFASRELAGGGALIDLGPHVIDSTLFLMGEPRVVAVSAVAHGVLGRSGHGAMDNSGQMAGSGAFEVEDLASAILRLEGGASVALEISWAGHAVDDEDISIEVLGTEAGVRVFIPRYAADGTLSVFRDIAGRHATIRPDTHVPGGEHAIVIAEFVDTVLSGDWEAHRGDFALHRTEILDACYTSAREGREVTL